MPIDFHNEKSFGVFLDCIRESAATTVNGDDGFVSVFPAGSSMPSGDVFNGQWAMTTDADDNELLLVHTTNEIFQFVQDLITRFWARLTPLTLPAEQNIFVGCMNAIATAPVVDAGAGPKATGDHFGFYTPESGGATFTAAEDNFWMARSQHNGVAIATILDAARSLDGQDHLAYTAGGVGIERDLIAECVPTNAVPGVAGAAVTIFDMEVRFWLDGVLVAKHLHRGTQQVTIASTTLMNFGVAVQNITDIVVLNLDFLKCEQLLAPPGA